MEKQYTRGQEWGVTTPRGQPKVQEYRDKNQIWQVVEQFEGYVERVSQEVAYLSLTDSKGRMADGQYDASKLQQEGIQEGSYFTCTLEACGDERRLVFEAKETPSYSLEEGLELLRELEAKFANFPVAASLSADENENERKVPQLSA